MDYATVTVIEDEVLIVETAQQGPPGAQGPQGPSGSAEVYIAASAISGHIVVTLDSAGQVIPADPNTAAHGNTIIGVTVGAAIGGDPVELATSGLVAHSGWSFTVGQPVFAGTAGAITQTSPAGLWQKVIGTARTATSFVLNLQPAIFI